MTRLSFQAYHRAISSTFNDARVGFYDAEGLKRFQRVRIHNAARPVYDAGLFAVREGSSVALLALDRRRLRGRPGATLPPGGPSERPWEGLRSALGVPSELPET